MAAALYLLIYLICGVLIVRFILPAKNLVVRVWLGLSLGLILCMCLPAALAFLLAFSLVGHLAALLLLIIILGICYLLRDKKSPKVYGEEDKRAVKVLLITALPLTILGLYLQYTHNLRPAQGALHVGQSTFADLQMHVGMITSLVDAKLPAEYNIFPGARLSYPFLVNSLSTGLLIFGSSIQLALILPGTLMMGLVLTGYVLLALRISKSKRAVILAFALLFINGGLGFLYAFDMAGVSLGSEGANAMQSGVWAERLNNILNNWYQTPTNHREYAVYNLRWSNIIADILIPQRTFLAGWCVLLPCIYLLYDGLTDEKTARQFVLLGIMAGLLPLIHTHSYLALALISFGWMIWDIVKNRKLSKYWLIYAGIAALISLPQLMFFTFGQAAVDGSFIKLSFNWVNGQCGTKDYYLWFYIKNIGLPFLLLIFSLFEKNPTHRFIYLGAFMIFLPAEFIIFQPNEYDNNKLFYVWYALCCIPIAEYAVMLYDKMKGLRSQKVIAVFVCVVFFLSGGLSILREIKSDYILFSSGDVKVAEWAVQNTDKDSLFISGTGEVNPISSLSGRKIVCGNSFFLTNHGFDIKGREDDLKRFYMSPAENLDVIEKYGADYILYRDILFDTPLQKSDFDSLFNKVYDSPEDKIAIYKAK
ncbi:MAG: hypothetical protein GX684_05315 [Ruminococcaceae bacterium]|nr:hypothetical protein [Oscillospiraceae bacterium]